MYITHSVSAGHSETDVTMEEEFWNALRDIAADRNTTFYVLIDEVVTKVDGAVDGRTLASVFRTYALEYYLHLPARQQSAKQYRSRDTVRAQLH
jgi:predicted DNA-binding ribbon-helix-helix protein